MMRLIRENRGISFMLFFLLLLYGFFSVGGVSGHKNHRAASVGKDATFTSAELKQKEETALQNLKAHPELSATIGLLFLAVLGAGIGLDIYLLLRGFQKSDWAADPSTKPQVRWGPRQVLSGVVFIFFIEGVIDALRTIYFWTADLDKIPKDILLLQDSLLRDFCAAVFVWGMVRRHGQSLRDLGVKANDFLKNVKTGMVGYIAVIPPMLVGFMVLAALMNFFSYEPAPQNVVQIYLKKNTGHYLFVLTLFVAVIGPIFEEIFFRGFAYAALKRRLGVVKAMVLTAAVFAGFHMNLTAFVPIFFLGLFLCYLYESTGSLVPSISAHILHNSIMVVMTLGFRSLSGGA